MDQRKGHPDHFLIHLQTQCWQLLLGDETNEVSVQELAENMEPSLTSPPILDQRALSKVSETRHWFSSRFDSRIEIPG